MSGNIQLYHNHKDLVVITRTDGRVRQHTHRRISAMSLRRLERYAKANLFEPLPSEWRIPGWWQREKIRKEAMAA